MQSYSIELDPDLTVDMLSALGPRLDLPDGWSFASRVVEEDLVVEDIDGQPPSSKTNSETPISSGPDPDRWNSVRDVSNEQRGG